MLKKRPSPVKNIVLVVGMVIPSVARGFANINKNTGVRFKYYLMTDRPAENKKDKEVHQFFDQIIIANFDSEKSITTALAPHQDRIIAVTCRSEAMIPLFAKIIPHLPYLRTPTVQSLEWSTNKIKMRRRFRLCDKRLTPDFLVVTNARQITLKKIENRIKFPLVIKPSGLASSLLVTICYHREELEKNLKKIFRKIKKIYKDSNGRGEPEVLVEQFIEGDMYSIDAYVNSRGKVYFCPMVSVITGRQIGFDDFFAYRTMTPTNLNKTSVSEAEAVSIKAIHALGLRSITAHIELYKTEKGWKVIEIGPRVGGFRQKMYELSFGIDHTANDIFIRIPRKPRLAKRVRGYTATFKFFAKKEGRVTTLIGIKKAQQLKSFNSIAINKKIGDRAAYAKNGGKSIFNITLFNKDRSKLLSDIRRLEQMVKIETE